jgi:hypothetical protein
MRRNSGLHVADLNAESDVARSLRGIKTGTSHVHFLRLRCDGQQRPEYPLATRSSDPHGPAESVPHRDGLDPIRREPLPSESLGSIVLRASQVGARSSRRRLHTSHLHRSAPRRPITETQSSPPIPSFWTMDAWNHEFLPVTKLCLQPLIPVELNCVPTNGYGRAYRYTVGNWAAPPCLSIATSSPQTKKAKRV